MTKHQNKKIKALLHAACRVRDGERCVRCGKQTYLQLSHVKSEGAWPRLKYELDNVKLLCNACHLFWWHKDVTEATDWFRKKFPDREARLKKMVRDYYKLEKPDYDSVCDSLSEYIENN